MKYSRDLKSPRSKSGLVLSDESRAKTGYPRSDVSSKINKVDGVTHKIGSATG